MSVRVRIIVADVLIGGAKISPQPIACALVAVHEVVASRVDLGECLREIWRQGRILVDTSGRCDLCKTVPGAIHPPPGAGFACTRYTKFACSPGRPAPGSRRYSGVDLAVLALGRV
jgi:hypothetical protein